jgi:hypothetical protein
MALDLTSFAFGLKQYYTDARVREMVYKTNPLHALLPKMEMFTGENMPTPTIYGNPQSRSATFSTAQAQSLSSYTRGVKFIITRVSDYAIVTVDNQTMEASQGNAGAFLQAASVEFDGAINSLTRSLAIAEYGDGSGTIGRVLAEPSEAASTVITLLDIEQITNFEVGMVLNIWSAASGGTQRSLDGSTTDITVSAINRDTGVITAAQTYNSSGTITANDFIFAKGDRGLKLKGLAAWLPTTAPTSGDSFYGVDRSPDPTRLSGIRFDGSALPIEEALIQTVRRVEREGGTLSHIFMNFRRWSELEIALGSKVIYTTAEAQDMPNIGFRGILIQGSKQPIKVIADQNCPDDYAYALQMDTWQLVSLGRAVRVIDSDGLPTLRQASADGIEARYVYYAALRCFAPGYNAVITLPS